MADSRPEPEVVKTDEEWREILTPEQYRVLRQEGTERAGTGEYNKHYEKGTYYCAGCDAVLYDSETKVRPNDNRTKPCDWGEKEHDGVIHPHHVSTHHISSTTN